MDNERNWRFRLELTTQLGHMMELYTPNDIREYLAPMATQLVQDRVAMVRTAATGVLSTMLSRLHNLNHPILATSLAGNLVQVLGHSQHWAKRQTYAQLCGELVKVDSGDSSVEQSEPGYSASHFSSELLPHLLDLTWDKVPNVRLAVARVVSTLPGSYQTNCVDLVETALAQLKEDKDADVRSIMNPNKEETVETEIDVTSLEQDQEDEEEATPAET